MTLFKIGFSVIGIYTCFLTWGVLQERISTTPYGERKDGRFRYFIFLNMIQSLMASTVAFTCLTLTRKSMIENINLSLIKKLIQVAFVGTIGPPFGYESLKHIDYPTIILVTVGVSTFMLLQPVSEKKKSLASNSLYGILLLSTNLLIDGITNSTQDQIFHKFKITGLQMMFFMNLFSGTFTFSYLLFPNNPELNNAIEFCGKYPEVFQDILLFSICGAVGQCFIFFTLQNFGSLVVVTITVTRKLFTMLISIFWFDHHLGIGQWFAVALVFSGIGLESYIKKLDNSKNKLDKIRDEKKE
ncbi:UAA transporter [Rhizophagus clarus]|uniref:UDP-galactose transporter homolog 1 n=1 Tax=Rhizophagus clarus TaxID=94130 RepID=A0A8H3QDZ3_9GLOM|nr:UAA transporter [Rhizophagus clarus]